jgi:hypothetical protein
MPVGLAQYLIGDDGESMYGVWLRSENEADRPNIINERPRQS